jgi:hypothetical protein
MIKLLHWLVCTTEQKAGSPNDFDTNKLKYVILILQNSISIQILSSLLHI